MPTSLRPIVVLGLATCLSAPSAPARPAWKSAPRAEIAQRLGPDELSQVRIPYEDDGEIRRLAAELTSGARRDDERLERLLAFLRGDRFRGRYDATATRTAKEVLANGRGNCLSYANLLVALARASGLRAHYADASREVHEDAATDAFLVEYGHIVVAVPFEVAPTDRRLSPVQMRPGDQRVRLVDFDGRLHGMDHFELISDIEAIAEFYNDLGYEAAVGSIEGLRSPEAFRSFHLATRIDPGSARAWNNLGASQWQRGDRATALASFERAVKAERSLASAHYNLHKALLSSGRAADAMGEIKKACKLRPDNPAYRACLAELRERLASQVAGQ